MSEARRRKREDAQPGVSVEEAELIAEACIGDEARQFLESDLGRTVMGIAEQGVENARLAMEVVDPHDAKAMMKLQNEIALGRRFKGWMIELLNRGENALQVWEHRKTDNG